MSQSWEVKPVRHDCESAHLQSPTCNFDPRLSGMDEYQSLRELSQCPLNWHPCSLLFLPYIPALPPPNTGETFILLSVSWWPPSYSLILNSCIAIFISRAQFLCVSGTELQAVPPVSHQGVETCPQTKAQELGPYCQFPQCQSPTCLFHLLQLGHRRDTFAIAPSAPQCPSLFLQPPDPGFCPRLDFLSTLSPNPSPSCPTSAGMPNSRFQLLLIGPRLLQLTRASPARSRHSRPDLAHPSCGSRPKEVQGFLSGSQSETHQSQDSGVQTLFQHLSAILCHLLFPSLSIFSSCFLFLPHPHLFNLSFNICSLLVYYSCDILYYVEFPFPSKTHPFFLLKKHILSLVS